MDSTTYGIYSQLLPTDWKYAMTGGKFINLIGDILNGTITSWWETGLFQVNSDYILSATYYPIVITPFVTLNAVSNNITIGKTTKSDASYENQLITVTKPNVNLFNTTVTRTYNNFLDYEPYTKFTLYVPYFEPIVIPTDMIYKGQLSGWLNLDLRTGMLTLSVTINASGVQLLVDTKSCKIGIDLPMGRTNKETVDRNNLLQSIGILGSLATTTIGVASGNPIVTGGSVGLVTKTATSLMENNTLRMESYKGANGRADLLACDKHILLYKEIVKNPTYPNYATMGKPYKQTVSLSGLSGLTQIRNFQLKLLTENIMDDEVQEIQELFRTGVIL